MGKGVCSEYIKGGGQCNGGRGTEDRKRLAFTVAIPSVENPHAYAKVEQPHYVWHHKADEQIGTGEHIDRDLGVLGDPAAICLVGRLKRQDNWFVR